VIRALIISLLAAALVSADEVEELVQRVRSLAQKEPVRARQDTLRQLANPLGPAPLHAFPLPAGPSLEAAVAAIVEDVEKSGDDPEVYNWLTTVIRHNELSAGLDNPSIRARLALADLREQLDPVLLDLNGGEVHVRAYKDRKVVLSFWATWCLPCRDELAREDRETRPANVVLLAISDEPVGTVRQWAAEHHYSFPLLIDPHHKLSDRYRVDKLPATRVLELPSVSITGEN